jgi:hypothetical protein
MPSVPTPRVADSVVIGPSTILVFPEGDVALPILSYDTEADAWSEVRPASLPPFGTGTDDVFVQAHDGSIYRFDGAVETTIHRYDPQANRWDPDAVAVLPDSYVTDAVLLGDGSMLLVSPGPQATTCLRSFDPVSGTATPLMCQPGAYWHAALATDGTIILYGESGVARYDLDADSWVASDPPPVDLVATGMGLGPDGRVYAFGGPPNAKGIAIAFDPTLARWLPTPSPGAARTLPEVVAGPDGRLYLIGGNSSDPSDPVGPPQLELRVEVFDPAS